MKSRPSDSHWVVYGAVAANLGVCAAKFTAAILSGSAALMSEALHSLADTGNELLLLWGLRRSQKAPDREHPYGYGKELYFWSLIVALLLFGAGGGSSIYEGVQRLIHPEPLHASIVNYVVIGVAFALESASLWLGVRKLRKQQPNGSLLLAMRRSKDPTIFTVVAEDSAALAGLIAALLGISLSQILHASWCDAVGSIVVGLILASVGIFLASESRKLLVGEAGSQKLLDDVRRLAMQDAAVRRVGDALSMQLGPDDVLVNLDVEFWPQSSRETVPDLIQRLEEKIREAHPEVRRLFVQASRLTA